MKITNKEMEILEVLWQASNPLTVIEIVEFASNAGKTLKHNTVQSTINKLVDKGLVEVDAITQPNKVLARTFKATVDRDQLSVLLLKNLMGINSEKQIPRLLSTLLENEQMSQETIDELELIIKELKDR